MKVGPPGVQMIPMRTVEQRRPDRIGHQAGQGDTEKQPTPDLRQTPEP